MARWMAPVGIILLLISIIAFAVGMVQGSINVAIIIIIPIFIMKGIIGLFVIASFTAGMVLLFLSFLGSKEIFSTSSEQINDLKKPKSNWGGVVFLGPIPVVFGDRETRSKFPKWYRLLLIGIAVFLLLYIMIAIIFYIT
jgi:uncharacterized membrane protein